MRKIQLRLLTTPGNKELQAEARRLEGAIDMRLGSMGIKAIE
jgi:hypothetical protein